jgi:hypothetical protein
MRLMAGKLLRDHAFALLSAVLAILSVAVSVYTLAYSIERDQAAARERLSFQLARPSSDYPTFLFELFPPLSNGQADGLPMGGIYIYVEVIAANNSGMDVSLVSYNVQPAIPGADGREADLFPPNMLLDPFGAVALRANAGKDFGGVRYQNVMRGIVDREFRPLSLPLIIPAGQAVRFNIALVAVMDWHAYALALEQFENGFVPSLLKLEDFLASRQTNRFGARWFGQQKFFPGVQTDYAINFFTGRRTSFSVRVLDAYNVGLYRIVQ